MPEHSATPDKTRVEMPTIDPSSTSTTADSVASIFRPMPGPPKGEVAQVIPKPADTDLPGWRAALVAAGVNANRVTSPDLLGQLEQACRRKIDTIICSVLDTDPSVPLNTTIAEEHTNELAAGIDLLSRLTSASRVWIAADPDKSAAWFSTVRARVQNPGLRLVPLRGDYPQTDPTLMLYTLLQRRLLPGKLPTEENTLLLDAAAAVSVGRYVLQDHPSRITELAVRDHFRQKTYLLEIPVGTTLAQVCDFLEIHHADAVFRAGDFLRDQWITPDTPLGHGELVIHPTAKHLDANPDPCIHCGWCLEACPTRIHPAGLLDAAQQNDLRAGKRFGIEACIECGICSYVCPTRLPLLTAIRKLKQELR